MDDMNTTFDKIEAEYEEKNQFLGREYNRDLPFQDAMFDRWKRAEKLGFGKGTSIYNSACVFGNVIVGKNVWIGPNVILDASAGKLEIGDGVTIASGVHIYTHDNILKTLSGGTIPIAKGDVYIGAKTYIGSQTIINKSVKIGHQVVVAAQSFVNRDVPSKFIMAGRPAKKIGYVDISPQDTISLIYD